MELIFIILSAVIYFIPSIVAHKRKHISHNKILLVNIFAGWTFIGWWAALIWAFMGSGKK